MTTVIAPWEIAAATAADRHAVERLFAACAAETLRLRFLGRVAGPPAAYLDAVLAATPEEHDAVVARPTRTAPDGGPPPAVVGLASLGAGDPPELGVLVADGWQRRGVGAAMVGAVLRRARDRGVRTVAARVLPGRSALLAPLARRLEPVRWEWAPDCLTGVFALRGGAAWEPADRGSGWCSARPS